jgi:hypothetical protein
LGVNDFNEACKLPWTSDLVRLGVSAMLALGKLENRNWSPRCPDPFQEIQGEWVFRRLAPDSSKIELEDLGGAGADEDMERKVFESMGAEIGNPHHWLHKGRKTARRPGRARLRRQMAAQGGEALDQEDGVLQRKPE